jgi:hypothetical protein
MLFEKNKPYKIGAIQGDSVNVISIGIPNVLRPEMGLLYYTKNLKDFDGTIGLRQVKINKIKQKIFDKSK